MSQDTSQVRVGITGDLYVAPLGTTVPVTTAGAWTGWTNMGILDEEASPELTPNRSVTDIMGWQKFFPVRSVKTADGMQWTFTLIQRSGTTLKLAFGGGAIAPLGGGDYRYTPAAAAFIDERMFGLEVTDGSIIDRYILRRGFVVDTGAVPFKKNQAVKFPLTVRALEPSSGERWELVSNDPAMAV